MNIFNHPRKGCIYIYYICVRIQWPSRFLPSVTASQAALFCEGWISRNVSCTLALMGPFLLLAGELKLLAACRRIKTQIWNKTLKSLKSLTILNWGSPTVTWDANPTATGRGPSSSLSEWDCHSEPICRMILGGTGISMCKHIMVSLWNISDPAKLRWNALIPLL